MEIEIQQVGAEALARYAQVPIAFRVRSMLRVEPIDGGLGGLALIEEPVDPPYVKEYGEEDGEDGPTSWPEQFDVSKWGFFLAVEGDRPVGGAAVAVDTAGVHMLGGRKDLAVLWDIRVHPERRGQGIGDRLFQHAADWARRQGCSQLKIETQNVNVPACRFYARQGCELGAIAAYAYSGQPHVAHEVMLLWYLDL